MSLASTFEVMVFPRVRRLEVDRGWGLKGSQRFMNVFVAGDSIFNFTVKGYEEKTPARQVERRVVQATIHDQNKGASH